MDKENVYKRNNAQFSKSDEENDCDVVHTSQPTAKKLKHAMEPINVNPGQTESYKDHQKQINDFVDNLDDFFGDDEEDELGLHLESPKDELYMLDLSNWKRCKITSVLNETQSITIVVEEQNSGSKAKCIVQAPWTSLRFLEGDFVSLNGSYDRATNSYHINSQDGMIVTHPDNLVSGTTVVGALYCQRRGVLQERFRGIDTDSKIMTIGTIIHALLQKTLRNKITDIMDIIQLGEEYINSKEMASTLFACQMSRAEAAKEVEQFYPKIHDFLKKHFHNQPSSYKSDLQIHSIKDIEENIWCHQLGLKGRIDVTVEAKCDERDRIQTMPLELKTGRASFSAEHKGQIALYEMMMNLVGHHVEKGILLYLREGKCAPVSSNRNIRRDLIMLRNEVAYYLSRGLSNTSSETFDISKDVLPLPAPLNNQHVCSRCPYSVICTAFLKTEKIELPEGHSIKLIAAESLRHLTDAHIDYFIRWVGLIFLEDEQAKRSSQIKHLWTKSPADRHKTGRAAINLKLVGRVFRAGDECFHTFALESNQNDTNNDYQIQAPYYLSQYFEVNEYLICSTNTRIAVAAGRVVGVGKGEVTMSLERDLSQHYSHELFHLDKYESHSSTTFNLTNIGVLLDNTERSETLRRIIIDCEKPTFTRTVPVEVASPAKQILQDLNKQQKIAVLTAIGTKSFCLFKGLPGTGKTKTVIALIRLLVAMGKTVLITSNTHSAVDNVLKRLIPHNIKFLRLGVSSRIDPNLKDFSEDTVTQHCSTPEQITAVYDSFKVVGVTCLGSGHSMLVQRRFDFCIVDEATQVFQCAVLRPLLFSDRFVLIGDPDQLPPVIISRKAKELGAEESLFFRLDTDQSCCVLPTQYRMNKTITRLANDFSYKGKLLCANEAVANATLKLPRVQIMQQKHKLEKWLLRATASQLELSVVLINTLNTFKSSKAFDTGRKRKYTYNPKDEHEEETASKAIYENYCEAAIVFYTIMALIECGLEGSSIGVIAPFRAQVELLRYYLQLLKKLYENENENTPRDLDIEVNTVDQYQGKDKDVILYSCTRSINPDLPSQNEATASEYEILQDNRRLTVAITRAKKKLIIVGDTQSLEVYTPFSNLFRSISAAGKITLQDRSFGFDWTGVFNTLDALHDCEK
ncbi:DNA replication ATP-dependent helicase/nuclease DNA2 isoform X2 [Topomyia yanbarensis]|uniref:DNA replication ATP-dependent helicase/nuclease DNA2 isoform X2 n=1 Tax=Topomyia yanbarensis TaxID=2498891 RepID=UPI00273B2A1E|nr:DNA replication ATP-dependent helicase/nuclease DNA2 isoform X2 [Topomyia yanbarensis]